MKSPGHQEGLLRAQPRAGRNQGPGFIYIGRCWGLCSRGLRTVGTMGRGLENRTWRAWLLSSAENVDKVTG